MNALTVNNINLIIKEYMKQRVVTFKDVDNVHQRPTGTAGRNFRKNRKYFIENEDFYDIQLTDDEIRRQFGADKRAGRNLTLLTETGYLMLVKSFTDDLAWEVQRKLVKSYFRGQESARTASVPITSDLNPKFFDGKPVMTVRDVEAFFGISAFNIKYHIKRDYNIVEGVDYKLIRGAELQKFKRENCGSSSMAKSLYILDRTGVEKIIMHGPYYSKEMIKKVRMHFMVDQELPAIDEPSSWLDKSVPDIKMSIVFDFMKFLLSNQHDSGFSLRKDATLMLKEVQGHAARTELLRRFVELKKKEMREKPKLKDLHACEALGAILYSSLIGDISTEKADQMKKNVLSYNDSFDYSGDPSSR